MDNFPGPAISLGVTGYHWRGQEGSDQVHGGRGNWAGPGSRGAGPDTCPRPAEYPFHQSPMVTRSCSSSCIATDPDSIGAAHLVFCCFHDLCNSVQASRLLGHLP